MTPRMLVPRCLFLAVASLAGAQSKPASSAKAAPSRRAYDKALLQGLQWRSIGPYRGGRVTAVTGVPGQPRVYYFGATGGGVWKTTDAGINWQPVTDGQLGTGSVGAVAVAESDPNVVYVGMGESCIRGNVSHGDGVYKSVDAGKTWKNVGLEDTRQIGRVRVHPDEPRPRVRGRARPRLRPQHGARRLPLEGRRRHLAERPVRGRQDGRGGPRDGSHQPARAVRRLLAGAAHALEPGERRAGQRLWKSVDGGDNWTKLTGEGLPKGVWGRIGVTRVSRQPEPRVGDHRGGGRRRLPLRRRGQDLAEDERRAQAPAARLVLHAHPTPTPGTRSPSTS